MRTYPTLLIAFFLLVLSSCARVSKTELSDEGKALHLITDRPSDECRMTGFYEGINEQGSLELARIHARNLAARDRADSIKFNESIKNGAEWRVIATGYRCFSNER